MSGLDTVTQPPQRILLATDLEAHSDRALDRAALLARRWRAALHVIHVQRPGEPTDWWACAQDESVVDHGARERLERQVWRNLREPPDDLVIHLGEGDPAEVVLQTAAREGCELVVVGNSGPVFAEVLGQSTTVRLLRQSPLPVLVVKQRPHDAYRKLLVGTDFTPESRNGLATAITWFADADFTLMHSLDIPYRSLLLEADRGQEFSKLERDTMQSFVAASRIPGGTRQRLHTHVEYGPPETMLRSFAIASDIDLTVIGALKRGLAFRMVVGGNASRIMEASPSDVLVVRAQRERGA